MPKPTKLNFSFLYGKDPASFLLELEHATACKQKERSDQLIEVPRLLLSYIKEQIYESASSGSGALFCHVGSATDKIWIGRCRANLGSWCKECLPCRNSSKIAATTQRTLVALGFTNAKIEANSGEDLRYNITVRWFPKSQFPNAIEMPLPDNCDLTFLDDMSPQEFLTDVQCRTEHALLTFDSQKLLAAITDRARKLVELDGDDQFSAYFDYPNWVGMNPIQKEEYFRYRTDDHFMNVAAVAADTLEAIGFKFSRVQFNKNDDNRSIFLVTLAWTANRQEELTGECSICYEEDVPLVRVLPCEHMFCGGCVKNISKCSLCRAEVKRKMPAFKQDT